MKTNLFIAIALIMLATTSINAQFAGGDGSVEDPYQYYSNCTIKRSAKLFHESFYTK